MHKRPAPAPAAVDRSPDAAEPLPAMDGADAAALARARRGAAPKLVTVPPCVPPPAYRVAVLGAAEAGKTALVARWADKTHRTTYEPTLGAAPRETAIMLGPAQITLVDWSWDHVEADVSNYWAKTDAAVLAFSRADAKSLAKAVVSAVEYGATRPTIFVGTHGDKKLRCDADLLAKKGAVACSCATGAGVNEALAALRDVLGLRGETSRGAWLQQKKRWDAYTRFLRLAEAALLDLVKQRLGLDDGLEPEATLAAALKLRGYARAAGSFIDNLARAAALHDLDDAEADDEDDVTTFVADASVVRKPGKRIVP